MTCRFPNFTTICDQVTQATFTARSRLRLVVDLDSKRGNRPLNFTSANGLVMCFCLVDAVKMQIGLFRRREPTRQVVAVLFLNGHTRLQTHALINLSFPDWYQRQENHQVQNRTQRTVNHLEVASPRFTPPSAGTPLVCASRETTTLSSNPFKYLAFQLP